MAKKKPWSCRYQFAHAYGALSVTLSMFNIMPEHLGPHFPGKAEMLQKMNLLDCKFKACLRGYPNVHKANFDAVAKIVGGYACPGEPDKKQPLTWVPVWIGCDLLWAEAIVACPLWAVDQFWEEFLAWNRPLLDKIEEGREEECDLGYQMYLRVRKTLHRGSRVPL